MSTDTAILLWLQCLFNMHAVSWWYQAREQNIGHVHKSIEMIEDYNTDSHSGNYGYEIEGTLKE